MSLLESSTYSPPLLKDVLIDEFQQFFYRYKKDDIYAYALILDQFQKPKYVCISTLMSIFNESEDPRQYLKEEDKWKIDAWRYKSLLNADQIRLEAPQDFAFESSILSDIYSTSGIIQENSQQDQLYIEHIKNARDYLFKIYKLDKDKTIFMLGMQGNTDLLLASAPQLNEPSSLLYEFMATLKSLTPQHTTGTKLSQSDKDLLIDFAQMVRNLENDDPLLLAQQASMMLLDPLFLKTNPYIQNLIRTVAESDSQNFALNRNEVLERIQQFYAV